MGINVSRKYFIVNNLLMTHLVVGGGGCEEKPLSKL